MNGTGCCSDDSNQDSVFWGPLKESGCDGAELLLYFTCLVLRWQRCNSAVQAVLSSPGQTPPHHHAQQHWASGGNDRSSTPLGDMRLHSDVTS